MQKGASLQQRIIALEKRIQKQRYETRSLDLENKRMREFLRGLGHDPDQFRYTDRKQET